MRTVWYFDGKSYEWFGFSRQPNILGKDWVICAKRPEHSLPTVPRNCPKLPENQAASLPAEVEVKQKPVQETVENGIQFPNEYIWEDANYGVIDAFAPLAEIPVIDIASLNNVEELDKFRSALTSWGCFQV
ncbi:Hypothetical predicted protein [Olea europaea subsp. europaea]|uniref:Uncharacterized protein n=1 Tax=Olea europaea subsp. europaea TaxID=158383 RepID=A0A8S0RLI6_OLEEU|nr:Hypothetical predicted protein [Olea europaea subsp. europaea]